MTKKFTILEDFTKKQTRNIYIIKECSVYILNRISGYLYMNFFFFNKFQLIN